MEKTYLEIWKPVPGYEGRYEVSACGLVRAKSEGYTISPDGLMKVRLKKDYPHVKLFRDRKSRWFSIHRLVWMAFVGPIPQWLVVNHIDHNKTNNRLENLEVITHIENVRKSIAHSGYPTRGEKFKQTMAKRRAIKAVA